MPTRAPSPCAAPGCPALSPGRWCPAHAHLAGQAHRDYDRRRAQSPALARAAQIRNSGRWKKVAAIVRAAEPLCRDPLARHGGAPEATAQIHHIDPLATHPHLAYTRENLAGLCAHCHTLIEAMERKGHKTAHLFRCSGAVSDKH
jgi:5-methylcytosine-specific restriction enzyme A